MTKGEGADWVVGVISCRILCCVRECFKAPDLPVALSCHISLLLWELMGFSCPSVYSVPSGCLPFSNGKQRRPSE